MRVKWGASHLVSAVASITQAKDISLEELEDQFNLHPATGSDFLSEWQGATVMATEVEQYQLERLQQNYKHLSRRKSFSEESVKMVVLSPLLDLAGFYQAPFGLATEEPIEITSIDEGLTVRGKIDALVFQKQFWALVIESKSTRYDVLTALPQALTYMMRAPDKSRPAYGLLANGREFVFVKLSHPPKLAYERSPALSIEYDDQLEHVLAMLKHIGKMILKDD